MTNPPPRMTCEQLAQRLGVTIRFIRRLVDERRVPFLKVGKFVRFDPEHIERWLAEQHRSTSIATEARVLTTQQRPDTGGRRPASRRR